MPFLRLTLQGPLARLRSEKGSFWLTTRACYCGLVLGVGLSGCAGLSTDSSPEAKQKVVAERAEARWQFMMKGDLDHAYEYLSAGSKAATPLPLYKAKIKPGMWRDAKVGKIDCEAEICKVQMMVTYDFKTMKGIETPIAETWIIENGTAWYVYR